MQKLSFSELKNISRLYQSLPVVFLQQAQETIGEYLRQLWPDSEDVPANTGTRQTLERKFHARQNARFPLEGKQGTYPNTNPFSSHIRDFVRFDLFAQNCIKAGCNPFDTEFKERFPDLTFKGYGRWIGGMGVPADGCWPAVSRYLKERIGHEFVPFWGTDLRLSDNTMLHLGYLVFPYNDEYCSREVWGGDRGFAGADKRLLISDLCAPLPLFHYLRGAKWTYNPRTSEFTTKNVDLKKYIARCGYFAQNRFQYWRLHRQLTTVLKRIDSYREEKYASKGEVPSTTESFTW